MSCAKSAKGPRSAGIHRWELFVDKNISKAIISRENLVILDETGRISKLPLFEEILEKKASSPPTKIGAASEIMTDLESEDPKASIEFIENISVEVLPIGSSNCMLSDIKERKFVNKEAFSEIQHTAVLALSERGKLVCVDVSSRLDKTSEEDGENSNPNWIRRMDTEEIQRKILSNLQKINQINHELTLCKEKDIVRKLHGGGGNPKSKANMPHQSHFISF